MKVFRWPSTRRIKAERYLRRHAHATEPEEVRKLQTVLWFWLPTAPWLH